MQSDTQIWLAIARGDEVAYEQMYYEYYRRFFVYGQKITPDLLLIEDVIQEIMILIWQSRDTIPSIQYPSAYFYTSFRNLLIRKLKASDEMLAGADQQEDSLPAIDETIIEKEELQALKKQLDQASGFLTNRQREAIYLRFYEQLTYDEVAAVMGITKKATYKIIARALAELKTKYLPILLLFLQFYRLF